MTVPMLPTTINGRWELLLPEYRALRPEWATGWERERLASIYENVREGMVMYDIGTEEGDMSALYAKWGCEVVLVEPNPRVWPNVKAIWEANELPMPFACVEGFAASDDTDVTAPMFDLWPSCADGPMIGDHAFCTIDEYPCIPRVRIDTLSGLIRPPDAITIDVEGAELQVLLGAEKTLAEVKPLLWVSIHPEEMQRQFDDTVQDFWTLIRRHGYQQRLLAYDHELHAFCWHPDTCPEPVLP